MKPKILILAPHTGCATNTELNRTCDTRALEEANKMYSIAEEQNLDVTLFKTDTPRDECDGNREIFTDTSGTCHGVKDYSAITPVLSECCKQRQAIINYLEKNKDSDIIIFEMHSFPIETEEFSGNQMAVLAIDEYYPKTKCLVDYLQTTDINIHSNINDTRVNNLMLITSKYPNIKYHFLLEFNEDKKKLPDNQLNNTLSKIFSWSLFPVCRAPKKILYFSLVILILLIVYLIRSRDLSSRSLGGSSDFVFIGGVLVT